MMQSPNQYKLDKRIFTEIDFDNMQWHDNPIHAITFGDNFELLLDIDYIFEWIIKGNKYVFWISPSTLIFENVYDLILDIGPATPGLTIDFITKGNPQKPNNTEHINRDIEFDWTIETHEGSISFKSIGYKQFVRQRPRLLATQKIDNIGRGGITFDRITF
ncbi:hypothetical protein [Flavihumibacter sp. UBA7668]|uniref:hypothetical protein n=1 Tax=Flavihumibacter sp. UBA7668 TaxID=1946542 RepID=UPI0025BFA30F|nr:hypothetical protein [Flavihumibacter sp. UBA7668]